MGTLASYTMSSPHSPCSDRATPLGDLRRRGPHAADSRRAADSAGRRAPQTSYLKLEALQPIGSFKIRGAYNVVRQLTPDAA